MVRSALMRISSIVINRVDRMHALLISDAMITRPVENAMRALQANERHMTHRTTIGRWNFDGKKYQKHLCLHENHTNRVTLTHAYTHNTI